jgi:4-hydroxybenzoate polyprenyltransferase
VSVPDAGAVAELVRLPAVLSVPGDVLVGAAVTGQMRDVPRTAGLVAASSCLYLAGMALNDYADREVDALERPGRPIPSGRVTPAFALGLAAALTAGGAAFAIAADGPRALKVVAPLALAVWGYDLALKPTLAATPSMSACRGLDVVMGAGAHGAAQALPAAAVVAAHTAVVTEVSRREVEGGSAAVATRALIATGAVAAASAALSVARSRGPVGRTAALALAGAYTVVVGRAHADAIGDPSPERLQRAVGVGILGLIPLEAGLLAGAGALAPAAAVAALWPVARKLARKRAVT